MSSRLTVPVSKLTRTFTTTPTVPRPSHLLNNASKAAATGAGRKPQPIADEGSPSDTQRHHSTTTTTTTTPHRPVVPRAHHPTASRKPAPFMQTFHHSAPRPAAAPLATIDRAILPDLSSALHDEDPYAPHLIRVPLLPDNRSPPAGARPSEAADAPLPPPEISVVAADPSRVLPAALTEVEGTLEGVDGVELGFAHLLGREPDAEEPFEMGRGMIRDLWKGLMDDVFGGPSSSSSSSPGGSSGGSSSGRAGPAATA